MSLHKDVLLGLLNNAIDGRNITEIENLLEELWSPKYGGITHADILKIHAKLNQTASQVSNENGSMRDFLHDEAIKISTKLTSTTKQDT